MKDDHIRSFVMRYLEAEHCDIIEKHLAYITVKLSPSADKELTSRPYYWSFVERTGVTPETMTCTFIFDPEAHQAAAQTIPAQGSTNPGSSRTTSPGGSGASPAQPQHAPDSILGRYFGFVPTQVVARVPKDEVTFGSRRLQQIFDTVRHKGRFVHLYEQFKPDQPKSSATLAYENWLQINFKVDMACDMKRSEIHSLGIHLGTGEIRANFQRLLQNKHLTPRLPAQVFVIPDKITLARAVIYLEQHVEMLLKGYDHRWAEEAGIRLQDEIDRIHGYYEPLLNSAEPEFKKDIEAQYTNRRQEIEWQYRPRIVISVINCGLFHLQTGSLSNA